MAVIILPDAQEDLLLLQEYMLERWSKADWLKVEDASNTQFIWNSHQ